MTSSTAHPLHFRGDDGMLFGWLHPAVASRAGTGVVICSAFGFEALCSHRAFRGLAEALAAAGVPTLRFDYHGAGDSAGSDEDEALPGSWLSSIHAAVETLKRRSGVERVVLIGLRLGACLAAIAATQRRDIDGLVALAPVVSGRAYMRELRALQMAAAAGAAEDVLEAAGFVITDATRTAVSAMDVLKLGSAPAQRVLIVDRDDLSPDARWAQQLAAAGVKVDTAVLEGYGGLVANPHRGSVPAAAFARVVEWVREVAVAAVGGPAPAVAVGEGALPVLELEVDGRRVREQAITTGPQSNLSGMLTLPADAGEASGAPSRGGILLLNAGAIRRVGPSRLYVRLARRWAARGYTVLRIDLSGLGDSPARDGQPDNITYSPHAQEDVAEAIDFLRSTVGVPECHVVGMCSGAYHAFKAAVAGQPLRGVVLINPLTFFWKEEMALDGGTKSGDYQAVSFGGNVSRSLRDPSRWLQLLRGGFDMRRVARRLVLWLAGMLYRRLCGLLRAVGVAVGDHLPTELNRIARQRIAMHFVFSEEDIGLDVLRAEGGDTVGRLQRDGALSIALLPRADHLFTLREARERLVDTLDRVVGAADPGTGLAASVGGAQRPLSGAVRIAQAQAQAEPGAGVR